MEAVKIYKSNLKKFKTNKYILDVFKAFVIYFIYNPYDKISIDFKKEYFKEFKTHCLVNDLISYLYPIDFDIPKKDINKAIKTIKQYINNFKRYN